MTVTQKKRIENYLSLLEQSSVLLEATKECCEDSFVKSLYQTVFAPPLVCFVEWVLQEALAKGIKRLYFLARDGFQMYRTAEMLCRTKGLELDCRYLYGSRYAWRLPQFALEKEKCLDKICLGGIDITFEKVMKRGCLTQEEAMNVAEELGYVGRYREVLSYQEILELKPVLKNSQLFLDYVYQHSKEAYEPTLGYLKQEGLLENIPYALVDSGWVGSLQQTLMQLFDAAGCKKEIEGFYFGLYDLPQGVNACHYHTFYFGPTTGICRKVYFSNCLYEAVHSAPHGMTMGYKAEGQAFVPVFYNKENLNQARLLQMNEWLEEFLQRYTVRTLEPIQQPEKLIYRIWQAFMGNPTREEVEAYGNLLFSDDVTETFTQNVAAALTKEELNNHTMFRKILIKTGIRQGKLKESAWIEGSVVLEGSTVKWKLWNITIYKFVMYIRKGLGALLINYKKGDRK